MTTTGGEERGVWQVQVGRGLVLLVRLAAAQSGPTQQQVKIYHLDLAKSQPGVI
jgi:hypothetical protein